MGGTKKIQIQIPEGIQTHALPNTEQELVILNLRVALVVSISLRIQHGMAFFFRLKISCVYTVKINDVKSILCSATQRNMDDFKLNSEL